jgi:hypothetical protein
VADRFRASGGRVGRALRIAGLSVALLGVGAVAGLVAAPLLPPATKAALGLFPPFSPLTLDVATVTTGGTAVTAVAALHAVRGGFIYTTNSAGICVNILGVATTTDGGNTACVAQGVRYSIPPTYGAVSVNSTGSGVALTGYGFQ